MEPLHTFDAVALPLAESGIDTDQLCPARFIRVPYGQGYERILFHDRRFDADGRERADFVMNRPVYRDARILVAGPDFGIGSSRESAVAALEAYGFRCVIAPSYGDILFDNCFRRGILAIRLPETEVSALLNLLQARPGMRLRVDLERQTLEWDGGDTTFDIGTMPKECLLKGLDALDLARQHAPQIDAYEAEIARSRPWMKNIRMPL